MSQKIKALVLLSGGLDSLLAAKVLMDQGVSVTGLSFKSCFFNTINARVSARSLGIELKEVDFSGEHLKMVKNPKYGYGKNMNPCIDCHSMMFRYAKCIKEEEGYDFVASGEVLGQRPMSQNREALSIVAEYSGLNDLLLRPLSAKLLSETKPEKENWVNRGKLFHIKGRSRDEQMEMIKKFDLDSFATPGGGCLLTDPEISQRLLQLFEFWPNCGVEDVELIKSGRVFWADFDQRKILIVVGREKQENEILENLKLKNDILMELESLPGPLTLIRGLEKIKEMKNQEVDVPKNKNMVKLKQENDLQNLLEYGAMLTGFYAVKARGTKVRIKIF